MIRRNRNRRTETKAITPRQTKDLTIPTPQTRNHRIGIGPRSRPRINFDTRLETPRTRRRQIKQSPRRGFALFTRFRFDTNTQQRPIPASNTTPATRRGMPHITRHTPHHNLATHKRTKLGNITRRDRHTIIFTRTNRRIQNNRKPIKIKPKPRRLPLLRHQIENRDRIRRIPQNQRFINRDQTHTNSRIRRTLIHSPTHKRRELRITTLRQRIRITHKASRKLQPKILRQLRTRRQQRRHRISQHFLIQTNRRTQLKRMRTSLHIHRPTLIFRNKFTPFHTKRSRTTRRHRLRHRHRQHFPTFNRTHPHTRTRTQHIHRHQQFKRPKRRHTFRIRTRQHRQRNTFQIPHTTLTPQHTFFRPSNRRTSNPHHRHRFQKRRQTQTHHHTSPRHPITNIRHQHHNPSFTTSHQHRRRTTNPHRPPTTSTPRNTRRKSCPAHKHSRRQEHTAANSPNATQSMAPQWSHPKPPLADTNTASTHRSSPRDGGHQRSVY